LRTVNQKSVRRLLPYVGFVLVVGIISSFVLLTASGSDDGGTPTTALPTQTRLPPTSEPEGTPVRVLRYVQVGSEAAAATLYHPRAVQTVGLDRLTRSLALRRPTLSGADLRVSLRDQTTAGPLIGVAASGPGGDVEYSFVLRRSRGRWLVIYDSLVGDALGELVQTDVQRSIDPSVTKPSSKAVAAGARAQRRYRRLLASP
jgi:hypothetical protein